MSRFKRVFYLQFLGLVAAAGIVFWLVRHYPVLAWINSAQHAIAGMGFWGGVLYPLLYATCNILLLPGGVIAIGSGLFFGLWWGTALSVLGNALGAAVAFLISRKLGRKWIEQRIRGHHRWAALDDAIAREGWKIIVLSQIHPLFPTSLLNYMYGVTRISFGQCMLWVSIGQLPGMFLYAYMGTLAQLGLRLWRGETHPHGHEYIVWIGGLVLTIVVTTILGRLAFRLLAEAEETARKREVADSGCPENRHGEVVRPF